MSDAEKLKPKQPEKQGGKNNEEMRPGVPRLTVGDSVREEYLAREARQAQERAAQQEHQHNAQRLGALHQQLGIKDPNQLREGIIQKALAEGGARLHTSVPRDVSPSGNSGFQSLDSRVSNWDAAGATVSSIGNQLRAPGRHENVVLERELNAHGLAEIVDIRRKFKPGVENVIVPGKSGFLGIGGTPNRTERRRTGRDVVPTHAEMVSGGKDEPAVRITYVANSVHLDRDSAGWRDYSGRQGQMLLFEIVLPESVGREVEKQIESDPGFIRSLVERYAKEKVLKAPTAWEAPQGQGDSLRPPYERWDAKTGGKIYVQKEGEAPGWHDENVRKIRQE